MDIRAGSVWSRADKLAVRRMYLVQGLSPKEIGAKLDKTSHEVSCIVYRMGLGKLRREKELVAHESAEQEATEQCRAFVESVAVNSMELAEKTFALAHDTKDAKDMANLAMAAKNWVGLGRFGLNLEPGQQQSGGMNLSLIFAKFDDAQKQMVSVTPIQETVDLDLA